MICCLSEAGVELQQVRKERLSGKSQLQTPSCYTPDNCMPTHCYSIYEIFAPALLFPLVYQVTQNLIHYFCEETTSFLNNYLYIKIELATEMFYQSFLVSERVVFKNRMQVFVRN